MKRILCWDEKLLESNQGVRICQHKPEKRNLALICDDEWEGCSNGYASVIKLGHRYRLYYRAMGGGHQLDESITLPSKPCICVAESDDGIHFKKPNLGIYDYNGSKENNIVYIRENGVLDNFSVTYDENPNCPADEKFKALSLVFEKIDGIKIRKLCYYASSDGYTFRYVKDMPVEGTFDSYNITFWDRETEQYYLYYRNFHHPDGSELTKGEKKNDVLDIRDVRVATSKDFKPWEIHGRIQFDEGQMDTALYTNQIVKYYREKTTFIGFPVRYTDRREDGRNFDFMPLSDKRAAVTALYGREGTALTDCLIMTSSDGFTFNRRDEAFLTPGMETRNNWWYGDCYTAYGLIETEGEDGAPNEISFFVGENYRVKNVNFRRYTVRLDGFFSWYAPNKGGEVVTKAFVCDGDKMFANFSSSAHGGMKIFILDEDGMPIEGYESDTIFGDTTNRPVVFEKTLAELKGKQIRLKIYLQDCHLYSVTLEECGGWRNG